jgi:outer membrane murein-binding lipoprotein Lpp
MPLIRLLKTLAFLLGMLLPVCSASAQTETDAKINRYEKAIEKLQEQIDLLKKEVAALREQKASRRAEEKRPEHAQVFGFLQMQFENTLSQERSRFLIRRARFGVRGDLGAGVHYEVHTNLDDATGPLRNAWIDVAPGKARLHTPVLRFGQFKLPYSIEALKDNGATTPLIERAIPVEQLGFNHDRDIGIGLYTLDDPERRRPYEYFLSLTNGAGRNQFAPTRTKLFAGRIQLNTTGHGAFLGGDLAVGFATRQGQVENRNLPEGRQGEDERYGVDLEYLRGKMRLRGEYLWGRNRQLRPSGFYSLIGYHAAQPLELLLRYEGYRSDPNLPSLHRTTLGMTYSLSRSVQAQFNYEFASGGGLNNFGSGFRFRLQALFP